MDGQTETLKRKTINFVKKGLIKIVNCWIKFNNIFLFYFLICQTEMEKDKDKNKDTLTNGQKDNFQRNVNAAKYKLFKRIVGPN